MGSHSKVWTIRSGALISRYSPRNAVSSAADVPLMNRQAPPGRTSILSTRVVCPRGPHQRGMRSGSVIALNTSSRGPSNSRVMRISVSEGSVTFVADLLAVAMSLLLAFFLQVAHYVVELLESLLPRAAVRLQPVIELLQRLRAEAV